MTLVFPDTKIRAYYDGDDPYCCRYGCPRDKCGWGCPLLEQEALELELDGLLELMIAERKKIEAKDKDEPTPDLP